MNLTILKFCIQNQMKIVFLFFYIKINKFKISHHYRQSFVITNIITERIFLRIERKFLIRKQKYSIHKASLVLLLLLMSGIRLNEAN